MSQLYSIDQLVRYVYRETGVQQSEKIEATLASDAEWQRTHCQLTTAQSALPAVSFAPRAATIDAILGYSAETALPTLV